MQTQYISFCNKNGLNIKSNFVKTQILNELELHYDIKIIDKHHELFCEDKHINRMSKVPHVSCIKSNGNPYYMYLTKLNYVNSIIMIDKKVQMGYSLPRMIIIRLQFSDESLFDNTLFEGEMIHDKNNNWLFLISDLHVLRNKSLKRTDDLFKRINMTYAILQNGFQTHFQDLFSIQVKKYVHLKDIIWLYKDFATTLPYTIRGVYVKPIYSKFKDILLNCNDKLVKNTIREKFGKQSHFITTSNEIEMNKTNHKTNHKKNTSSYDNTTNNDANSTILIDLNDNNTKVLLVQKTDTPDLYNIYSEEGKSVGYACVDSMKTSKMLNACFNCKSMITKIKFLCEKTKNDHFKNVWIPIQML